MMKRILSLLLATLGLNMGCCQQNYENTDVEGFAALCDNPDVTILDVRTEQEFAQGHIERALNININDSSFLSRAKQLLPQHKTVALYCRSGKRSAKAAATLADNGFHAVNLYGGILAWQQQGKPTTTDNHEVDLFTTANGKTLRFHALMHASIRLQFDNYEIQIDPVARLGNRTTDFSTMPKADYILVTHEHADHFDQDAIGTLTGNNTRLITNHRCAQLLGYGIILANGDTINMDNITIEAVPAYNITYGHTQYHPKGRDNGFILTLDGLRIYIAGDTEDIPEMAAIKDIDIAFLPCNQPYTMTVDQLLRAARIIRPKVLFPYHYGQTDITAIPELLQPDGIEVRIRHYE